MLKVVVRQLPLATVFKPFLTHLIAADREVPNIGRHTVKILHFIDINATGLFLYSGVFLNIAIALRFIAVAMLRPLSTFASGGKFLPDSSNRWKPQARFFINLLSAQLNQTAFQFDICCLFGTQSLFKRRKPPG